MPFRTTLLALLATINLAAAHVYITYPGWRGDELTSNGTYNTDDYRDDLFPYGMEWMYPCGGLKISSNRTYWPINGGAISFQPGWFPGHQVGLIYVNMGLPDVYNEQLGYKIPQNYSHNVVKPFQITGPTNNPYPGIGMCLPQIPMPAGIDFTEGMNITIQVVLAAQHGAGLFSVSFVKVPGACPPQLTLPAVRRRDAYEQHVQSAHRDAAKLPQRLADHLPAAILHQLAQPLLQRRQRRPTPALHQPERLCLCRLGLVPALDVRRALFPYFQRHLQGEETTIYPFLTLRSRLSNSSIGARRLGLYDGRLERYTARKWHDS